MARIHVSGIPQLNHAYLHHFWSFRHLEHLHQAPILLVFIKNVFLEVKQKILCLWKKKNEKNQSELKKRKFSDQELYNFLRVCSACELSVWEVGSPRTGTHHTSTSLLNTISWIYIYRNIWRKNKENSRSTYFLTILKHRISFMVKIENNQQQKSKSMLMSDDAWCEFNQWLIWIDHIY